MASNRTKSPSQIMCGIIQTAMKSGGISTQELANRVCVHPNTVYSDFREPGKMQQDRMWLYFAALGIPVDEPLRACARAFAEKLIEK